MIEAALITPMLILLTVGVMEFGSMMYVFLALQNGVSQATRYAITGNAMRHVLPRRFRQGGDASGDADDDHSRQRVHLQPPARGRQRLRRRRGRAGRGREGDRRLYVDVLHADDAPVLSVRTDHHPGRLHHEERAEIPMTTLRLRRTLADASGQSLVEMAIILPLFLIIVLGIVEVGYALIDQHVTTRMTREGRT